MKALLLAALLTQAPDAPVAAGTPAVVVKAGEVLPFAGVCMDEAQALRQGQRIASCEATMAVVETKTVISTPVLVAAIVGVLALGFGGGFAIAKAVK